MGKNIDANGWEYAQITEIGAVDLEPREVAIRALETLLGKDPSKWDPPVPKATSKLTRRIKVWCEAHGLRVPHRRTIDRAIEDLTRGEQA